MYLICTNYYFLFLVGAGKNTPLYYEEDLFPGEIFGEAALGGMHTRLITAQTITEAELAVIDDQDFMMAQDKDAKHMAIEDRSKFLSSIPLFKNWDSYKLLRLAHALIQQEINKGVLLVKNGVSGKEVYFIVNGRVDVVDSMEKKNVITSLLKSDYVGETSLINKFVKSSTQKIVEECDAVAITKVDVLVLQETNFHLFDAATLDVLREGYFCKVKWRKERIIQSKVERAKVRKYQRMLSSGHDFPAINSPRETDSSERSLATSLFTITGLNTAKAVIAERASSPILNMPPSMKQKYVNQINTSAQVLLSDTINQVRISVGEKLKKTSAHAFRTADMQMLDDIEDIPELFSKEIDYLMIPQQQNSKKMEKVHETIKNGKLPKSARMKIRCAENLRESTLRQKRETLMNEIIRKFPGDKPFRSSVKIPSPISRPRTADTAVTLKAGELTKQGPNELQIQLNLPALSARPHTTQSVKLFKPDTMDSMDGYDIFKSLHENSAEYSANGDLLNRYLSSMGVDNEESSIGGSSLKLQGSSRIPHSKSYFESIGAAQDNVMDNLPLKISQSKLFSPKKKKSL